MLNIFEDYPFWHTMFTECGIDVILSGDSKFLSYEHNARMVMSDNICFPAKLVHSHVQELIDRHVDRIFMPFVVFERGGNGQNSYNCPVVTGYPEVVKSVQNEGVPIDAPTINFKDKDLLLKQLYEYFGTLGIDRHTIKTATDKAWQSQSDYEHELVKMNEDILQAKTDKHSFTIMLAGRPYHADPLIQHNVARMLSEMGIDVITDDIVRDKDVDVSDVHFISQWTYPNRILKAAKWCALQGQEMQFVEMTSFGCGPDAFLVDEVRDLLLRYGKALTLLKLDDINNIGSMKLRVRSLVESMKLASEERQGKRSIKPFVDVPPFDESQRNRKILAPYFTPFLSPLIPAVIGLAGYDCENLPMSDAQSSEYGLKYANNEVCYPATLIVGDMIKAFRSGRFNPDECAVAITQTGGQCRASNYLSLIKKAMVDAGYGSVPVISLAMDSSLGNNQPAFKIDWVKIMPIALRAILYSDCIAKFYYATLIRERVKGQADRLKDKYLEIAANLISLDRSKELYRYLAIAAEDFNRAARDAEFPKVGIVGEIFLKFNPFAHKHLMQWLTEKGIEVVPPILIDFFSQSFVNTKVKNKSFVQKKSMPNFLLDFAYKLVKHQINKINAIGSKFKYFIPFGDIFEEAEHARSIITLDAQFGEGWLLPAEAVSYHNMGINHVLSLQPFGCIANHIISKGMEKKLKDVFPDMFMLPVDFDSGVSDVNITNRMLLFIDNLKKHNYATANQY